MSDHAGRCGWYSGTLEGLKIDLSVALEHHDRFVALGDEQARRHFVSTVEGALKKVQRGLDGPPSGANADAETEADDA